MSARFTDEEFALVEAAADAAGVTAANLVAQAALVAARRGAVAGEVPMAVLDELRAMKRLIQASAGRLGEFTAVSAQSAETARSGEVPKRHALEGRRLLEHAPGRSGRRTA